LSASPEVGTAAEFPRLDGFSQRQPHHHQQGLLLPSFRFPAQSTQLFEELDPNVLLHAETTALKPISSISTSWAVLGASK